MSIQATVKQLRRLWHANEPLPTFTPIEAVEAGCGRALPADMKYFYQWFSDGGEGRLPGGYLSLYRMSEIPEIQEQYRVKAALPDVVVFASDGGDEAFAFVLSRHADTARYPVVQFSLGAMEQDAVEQVGEDFEDFLRRRLHLRPA
jgi:hypothetical protein